MFYFYIVPTPSKYVSIVFFSQGMHMRYQSSFPVITVPKLMQQNVEKKMKREEKVNAAKRLQAIRENSRKGNKNVSSG